jgi:hypothetical protein
LLENVVPPGREFGLRASCECKRRRHTVDRIPGVIELVKSTETEGGGDPEMGLRGPMAPGVSRVLSVARHHRKPAY